jgi:hypothetical protein
MCLIEGDLGRYIPGGGMSLSLFMYGDEFFTCAVSC